VNGSLRRRLFVWLSASIVIMGAATAALSFALTYREANELQDSQLRQVAAVLAAQASITHAGRFKPRDSEDAETHFVVKALDVPVESRDPMIDVFLPATLQPGLQSLEESDVDWRVMVSRNAGGQAFGVAQRQTVRDEGARDSALLALVPMLVLVPLLLLIVNFALRRGFAPLVALSREVDQADGGRLAPLEPSRIPLEALPLVQAVNRLLSRLGHALDQQRRMVADAAHELRTPVAATRVQADNLAHADLPPEARSRLELLQRGLARTSELIEQLLKLARVQGAPSVVHPFALEAVIRVAIEDSLPLAQSRGVDLGCLPMDLAEVRGDSLHAYALVRNVVDNAVRYTPSGGAVDVSVKVLDRHVVLTVEDTGPGIEQSQRERVFEPFYRIPGSQQLGSGLGLAIVRSAAQALGGTIELSGRHDGASGLRVTYRQRIE
jgi:signal transduction histidine kinase